MSKVRGKRKVDSALQIKPKVNGKADLSHSSYLLLALMTIAVLAASFSITFSYPAHAQTQVCISGEICDAELVGGSIQYTNCQSCPIDTVSCPGGTTVSVPQVCQEFGVSAECTAGRVTCPSVTDTGTKSVTAKFRVFTPKHLIVSIEPSLKTKLAGDTAQYTMKIKNPNTLKLDVLIDSQIPQDWSIDIDDSVTLSSGQEKTINFEVTSNVTSAEGIYDIVVYTGIVQYGLNIVDNATVQYRIASRGAPSVSVLPPAQREGIPGQSVQFEVEIKSGDPLGLDARDIEPISVRAIAPRGWNADVRNITLRLQPQESASINVIVTSSLNATGTADIMINATQGEFSETGTIIYFVQLCGNGVCTPEESRLNATGQVTCPIDCPFEENFTCAYPDRRCEQEIDTGVNFAARVSFLTPRFLVCKRGATPQQCESAYNNNACGPGGNCICGNILDTSCSVRCVDTGGVYYLYAKGAFSDARSTANYSFTCPFVNLDEIKGFREEFVSNKENFEEQYGGFVEIVNTDPSQIEKYQPCIDGLASIIRKIGAYVSFLDGVIDFPGKMNTTEARQLRLQLSQDIGLLYSSYCFGARGALLIDSLNPPGLTEKNTDAIGSVQVRNTGNILYYGYSECTFRSPGGQLTKTNSTCAAVPENSIAIFTPTTRPEHVGGWQLTCSSFGSINPDCSSASIHDTKTDNFTVFSKEVYVVSISGACSQEGVTCSVITSTNAACAECKLGDTVCQKTGQVNNTATFSCPFSGGYNNITGYVVENQNCIPVEPTSKTASVRCPICGDSVLDLDLDEACEPPDVVNSTQVPQEILTCDGKRLGTRDRFGYCTPTCQASPDPYTFACRRGSCGATCNDGESRNVTLTTPYGSCTYTQQCGADCDFIEGTCEPPINVSRATLTASHVPQFPNTTGDAIIYASVNDPRGILGMEIYVDDRLSASCSETPCQTLPAKYTYGLHRYRATVMDIEGNTKAASNQFFANDVEKPTLTMAFDPQSPTTDDPITITVTAADTGGSELRSIQIYVDNMLKQSCTTGLGDAATCATQPQRYGFGSHSYRTVVLDNATNEARIESTAFTVEDRVTPAVTATHNPLNPRSTDIVTISVNVNDFGGSGLAEIKIFVDGSPDPARTCMSLPCSYAPASPYPLGYHTYYATAKDIAGNEGQSSTTRFLMNDAPQVTRVSFANGAGLSVCNSGETITIKCSAADVNQADSTLSVLARLGQCNATRCFTTRQYTRSANMDLPDAEDDEPFTLSLAIDQPTGTGIVFSCQATDSFGIKSNELNVTPLCVVGQCVPPQFENLRVTPDPAKAGAATVTFTSTKTLTSAPSVTIRSQSGSSIDATCSQAGLSYTCSFDIQQSTANGAATAEVTGTAQDCLQFIGTETKDFTIDTKAPGIKEILVTPEIPTPDKPVQITVTLDEVVRDLRIFVDNEASPIASCLNRDSCSTNPRIFTLGNHSFRILATDYANNLLDYGGSVESRTGFTVRDIVDPAITSISHNPSSPRTSDNITINVVATDGESRIARIDIFIDNALAKTCPSSQTTAQCTFRGALPYGFHSYYAEARDLGDNVVRSATASFAVNDAPVIDSVSYTGQCTKGATLTLQCAASDINSALLSVKGSAGKCNDASCASRTFGYFSNATMAKTGDAYTLSFVVDQDPGKGVAASCQAADELNLSSSLATKYPLCVVDGCVNPPAFLGVKAVPDPAKAGTARISFYSTKQLNANPAVTVKPGGGTPVAASLLEKTGNSYTYAFSVQQQHANGDAEIAISGTDTESCFGSAAGVFRIDTQVPQLNLLINPSNGTTSTKINIDASAADVLSGVKNVSITVDSIAVMCLTSGCGVSEFYPYGTHQYYATAYDNADNMVRNPSAGFLSFRIIDATAPFVTVTSVSQAFETEDVTISAEAIETGGSGLRTMDIFVNGTNLKRCNTSNCTLTRRYTLGTYNYYAAATDGDGNNGTSAVKTFTISRPSNSTSYELPPNATITPNVTLGGCTVAITNSACTYDAATNRFTATLSATRNGAGDHMHGRVENYPSTKYYAANITFTTTLTGTGTKTFRAEVHDSSDNLMCYDERQVLCGTGGTGTGAELEVIRNMPEDASTESDIPVTLVMDSNKDLAGLTLTEYVPEGVDVSSIVVSGNNSAVSISGPTAKTQGGFSYNVYTLTTDLNRDETIQISYKAKAQSAGEYTFSSTAKAADILKTESKTVDITSCPQSTPVFALGPTGCKEFKDACSLPLGWTIVPTCEAPPPSRQEGVNLIIIIPIIIVIIAGLLIYKYKDKIKGKLTSGKEKQILRKLQGAA